ncbi:MAG: hypothetical protein LW822_09510 [Phycisphaeraceae bacterium]|jgi:hypothetical protein|nr:hypothetical protein [Phycisphaeraceae bacterium]
MGEYLSRFTFYDVFGYLLPGLIAVCAAAFGLSAANAAWSIPSLSDGGQWFALVVCAYFLGHATQGLSVRIFQRSLLRDQIARSCKPASAEVLKRALAHHDLKPEGNEARFAALDALKLKFDDREIFVARQGFFRGSSMAFGLVAVATLAAAYFARPVMAFGLTLDRVLCVVVGLVSLGLAVLFFFRYRDFLRHEMEFAAAEAAKEYKPTTSSNYLKGI